jgi:glyoxylate reductase
MTHDVLIIGAGIAGVSAGARWAELGRVLLPQMGSSTQEGRIEMGEKVLINIKTFADGHRPPDLVVPSML